MAEAGPSTKRLRSRSPPVRTIRQPAEAMVPIDLTTETPPEEGEVGGPASPLPLPEAEAPAPTVEPELAAVSPEKAVGEATTAGPSGIEPAPAEAEAGEGNGPSFTLEALAKRGKWAKGLMSQVCLPEMQADFLMHGSSTFFRDAAVSTLWAANTFAALETWFARASESVSAVSDEASAAKTRAEAAEAELERARAALEEAEHQIASEAEKTQAAERRADCALQTVCGLEELISSLREEMQQWSDKVTEAERRASEAEAKTAEAEKVAAEAEAKVAEAEKKTAEAEGKTAEAEKKAAEAEGRAAKAEGEAEVKIAEAEQKASEAVAVFRRSSAFKAEVTEASAFALDVGFHDCKRKMKLIFNIEGMEDVEPDTPENMPSSSSEGSAAPPET